MQNFKIQTTERIYEILATIKEQALMPVLGKDQLEVEDVRAELGKKSKVLVENGISVIEGTCRAGNYREVAEVLADLQQEIPGMIAAMGTQSNIVSIHYAVEKGVPVIVAADSMPPLRGWYTVPGTQKKDATDFVQYVRRHLSVFSKKLGLVPWEKEKLECNPLTMDPVAYCIARNVIVFPAWSDRDGLGDLLARGTRTAKAFNYSLRAPSGWDSLTAAISDDYATEIGERGGFMGTGGLSIKELKVDDPKQKALIGTGNAVVYGVGATPYADTVTPCLDSRYFIAAGSSDLGKGSVDEVAKKAELYVCRVMEHRQQKAK